MSAPIGSPETHGRRTLVIALISDILSGVDSWVWRLEAAFDGHERYDLQVVVCNRPESSNPRAVGNAPGVKALGRLLRERAPGILLPNYVWPALRIVARSAAKESHPRVVAYCHSDSCEEYYHPLEWYEPIVDHFVAVSSTCERGLADRVPARRADITLLPYGVRVGDARAAEPGEGPLRLLYAGRLQQEQKRILDLVPLAGELSRRGVDFRLTVVGEGPERGELERAMAPFGDRIEVLDSVPHDRMPSFYRQHDVLVLVSEFEGTSNSLLEAMALGTVPVLTRTRSGAEDVIRDHENGRMVEIGDMAGMADAVQQLARDRSDLHRLSTGAWETARRHSIEDNVAVLERIFDSVLQSPLRSWPGTRATHPPWPVKEGVFVPRRLRRLRQLARRLFDVG